MDGREAPSVYIDPSLRTGPQQHLHHLTTAALCSVMKRRASSAPLNHMKRRNDDRILRGMPPRDKPKVRSWSFLERGTFPHTALRQRVAVRNQLTTMVERQVRPSIAVRPPDGPNGLLRRNIYFGSLPVPSNDDETHLMIRRRGG